MSIGSYFRALPTASIPEIYRAIDAYAQLLINIVEFNGDTEGGSHARLLYLSKLLSLILLVFIKMQETLGEHFQQKPFFRLFSMMLIYLLRDNPVFQPIEYEVLVLFSETFSVLQPNYFPNFTFAWWALVSHPYFMSQLLALPEKKVFSHWIPLTSGMAGVYTVACEHVQVYGTQTPRWIDYTNSRHPH